jgi:hypothetical protein
LTPPAEDWNPTPTRPIRVPLDLWARFGDATGRAKTDRSKVLRDFMAWYAHDEGAKMPRRPGPAPTNDESAEPAE